MDLDGTVPLKRNLTVYFTRKSTEDNYVVSKISAVIETNYKYIDQATSLDTGLNSTVSRGLTYEISEWITMSTSMISSPLDYPTPLHHSYQCIGGSQAMQAVVYTTSGPIGSQGIRIPYAILSAQNIEMDAFRGESAPNGAFQTPRDCTIVSLLEAQKVSCRVTAVTILIVIVMGWAVCSFVKRINRRGHQSSYQSI